MLTLNSGTDTNVPHNAQLIGETGVCPIFIVLRHNYEYNIYPHFIFNSLANIQEFIWNKDPLTANEYLSSFSKLVRLILENM